MTALEQLTKPAETITNPAIERWKEKGGKVIGYYCTYVPEEVIHAAGMLPYRMRATGSTGTELGDVYSSHLSCSFVRHSLDQAMRGEYNFLDGLVALFSCDHIRRLFRRQPEVDFDHFAAFWILAEAFARCHHWHRRTAAAFDRSLLVPQGKLLSGQLDHWQRRLRGGIQGRFVS